MILGTDTKVYSSAGANLAASGFHLLFEGVEPTLRIFLIVGQIAVAVATARYIWKKTKQNKKNNDSDDEPVV